MDTERFDRLSSTFAGTRSRRSALRLLAAAALGAGGLTFLGNADTEAKKRRKKKSAGHSGGHDGGRSIPRDQCPVSAKTNAPVCGWDPDGDCDCHRAIEGNNFCGGYLTTCTGLQPCTSTQDCRDTVGFHFVCQDANGGGCGQVCVPEVQNPTSY
jgi:hypothetical protein